MNLFLSYLLDNLLPGTKNAGVIRLFLQPHETNAKTLSYNRPRPLLSTSTMIHHSQRASAPQQMIRRYKITKSTDNDDKDKEFRKLWLLQNENRPL